MKELIFRNEAFEIETRAGLNETLEAYKKLLEIWNSLDVGGIMDHYALATQPVKVYTDAYQAGVEVPEVIGTIKISRQGFMNLVEVPVPNSLYVAAKQVVKSAGFGYRDCFVLKDGTVELDKERAEEIINSQNIYALNPEQKELGEAVIEYVRLSNYIDKRFTEIPWQYLPAMPWTKVGRHFSNIAMLTLEVERLRTILSKVE